MPPRKPKASRLEGLQPSSDLALCEGSQGRDPNFFVLGLDEVGVGCLAGPVVAACFAYRPSACRWGGPPVIDSKKLSDAQRLEARDALVSRTDLIWAVAEASAEEIDRINILRASQLAMERAFRAVSVKIGALGARADACHVLVDGNREPPFLRPLGLGGLDCIVKGDSKSFAIAAASILAKEHRDAFMKKLGAEFPDYGWADNVGYPAPVHKLAIARHGYTVWHRRSYKITLPEIALPDPAANAKLVSET